MLCSANSAEVSLDPGRSGFLCQDKNALFEIDSSPNSAHHPLISNGSTPSHALSTRSAPGKITVVDPADPSRERQSHMTSRPESDATASSGILLVCGGMVGSGDLPPRLAAATSYFDSNPPNRQERGDMQ